mmetsp:Transcript_4036/g.9629  ORF Transcript_4036/g.9629 Transcript_4036/m.9629 type:complete len:474 (-) Transcript_4036:6443-7864(-)
MLANILGGELDSQRHRGPRPHDPPRGLRLGLNPPVVVLGRLRHGRRGLCRFGRRRLGRLGRGGAGRARRRRVRRRSGRGRSSDLGCSSQRRLLLRGGGWACWRLREQHQVRDWLARRPRRRLADNLLRDRRRNFEQAGLARQRLGLWQCLHGPVAQPRCGARWPFVQVHHYLDLNLLLHRLGFLRLLRRRRGRGLALALGLLLRLRGGGDLARGGRRVDIKLLLHNFQHALVALVVRGLAVLPLLLAGECGCLPRGLLLLRLLCRRLLLGWLAALTTPGTVWTPRASSSVSAVGRRARRRALQHRSSLTARVASFEANAARRHGAGELERVEGRSSRRRHEGHGRGGGRRGRRRVGRVQVEHVQLAVRRQRDQERLGHNALVGDVLAVQAVDDHTAEAIVRHEPRADDGGESRGARLLLGAPVLRGWRLDQCTQLLPQLGQLALGALLHDLFEKVVNAQDGHSVTLGQLLRHG